jgi:hypothetical protein
MDISFPTITLGQKYNVLISHILNMICDIMHNQISDEEREL